jgi:hypothetical protein
MYELPDSAPVKFTITHYRQQQHSHEAFINFIIEEHLPLALPIFKKYGVIGYSLVSACCYNLCLLVQPCLNMEV